MMIIGYTLEIKQEAAEIEKPVKFKAKIAAKNLEEARKTLPSIAKIISEQQVGEEFEINYETPAPTIGRRSDISAALQA